MQNPQTELPAIALYRASKRQARAAVSNQDPGSHPWLTLERAEEIQMVAAIGAVISEERERCAAIVRRFRTDEHADIMLQEIENGG